MTLERTLVFVIYNILGPFSVSTKIHGPKITAYSERSRRVEYVYAVWRECQAQNPGKKSMRKFFFRKNLEVE